MKANELRIGNLIIDEHGTVSNIVEITDYDRIAVGNNRVVKDLSNCEPIPLTEEWLLNFGFRDHIININDLEFSLLIKNKLLVIVHNDEPKGLCIDIEFVHQFQNIYFALNGEELTIKLP